jgi:hypothetical protein
MGGENYITQAGSELSFFGSAVHHSATTPRFPDNWKNI